LQRRIRMSEELKRKIRLWISVRFDYLHFHKKNVFQRWTLFRNHSLLHSPSQHVTNDWTITVWQPPQLRSMHLTLHKPGPTINHSSWRIQGFFLQLPSFYKVPTCDIISKHWHFKDRLTSNKLVWIYSPPTCCKSFYLSVIFSSNHHHKHYAHNVRKKRFSFI